MEFEFTTDDITDDYFESEATSQETAIQPVMRCSETKLQIIMEKESSSVHHLDQFVKLYGLELKPWLVASEECWENI